VGESSLAPFFVPGSHPVPDLEGDQRSFMIFEKDNFKAIGQYGCKHLLLESRLCQGGGKKTKEEEKKKATQF
jgi:hypothetical protein